MADPYLRNASIPHDTEDKSWWYARGEGLELSFVGLCKRLGIVAEINPQKQADATAPDLLVEGKIADLKTQNTPFFTAGRYGMQPRFTVTFNRKDLDRYAAEYPEIDVVFWLNWQQSRWNSIVVQKLHGIWRVGIQKIISLVTAGAPEHSYQRRQQAADRNAKSSFLLDVRAMEPLWVSEKDAASK